MLAIDYSEVGAVGAADTDPITVPGIAAGDVVLSIISWSAGADPAGIDVSEATVSAGSIALSTTDTTGKQLWVRWITPRA